MADTRTLFRRIDSLELGLCLYLNRSSRRRAVNMLFSVVSRLGDGVFWYALMLVLPLLYGQYGLMVSAQMMVTGLLGLAVYRSLKNKLVRERPFISWKTIQCNTPSLDRYSFPSGHTLHAVNYATLMFHYFPDLAWFVLPFSILVALSRVVLGLHYPSDVLAGAAIGLVLALGGIALVGVYW
jgi:undecaprenyl-diphosphatase